MGGEWLLEGRYESLHDEEPCKMNQPQPVRQQTQSAFVYKFCPSIRTIARNNNLVKKIHGQAAIGPLVGL